MRGMYFHNHNEVSKKKISTVILHWIYQAEYPQKRYEFILTLDVVLLT